MKIDINEIELTPGNLGKDCLGNGEIKRFMRRKTNMRNTQKIDFNNEEMV